MKSTTGAAAAVRLLFRRTMASTGAAPAASTFNRAEVEKFKPQNFAWQDSWGPAAPLQAMNALRVPWIRDGLVATAPSGCNTNPSLPLAGMRILDVGCGGGILSQPLARIGATVTGVDASPENVEFATATAAEDPTVASRLTFVAGTVEDFVAQNPEVKFDAVVASEVIEHVDNPELFVNACASLVSEGGSFFLTTVNRTWLSYAMAIVGAEYVLRLLPVGTHDWNKFVKPEEAKLMMEAAGCSRIRQVTGLMYFPFINKWTFIGDTSVSYFIHAIK